MKKNILSCTSLALVLAAGTAWADTTNTVYLTDFEPEPTTGRPSYTYPYTYAWGYSGVVPGTSLNNYFQTNPVPGDNVMLEFFFDNTFMTPVPEGAGYGVGFGGGLRWATDASAMTSTNREHYIIEFDARVESLLPEQTTANGEFQVRFDAPDDTVQPADANTDKDIVLQVNLGFNPGTN